jgi:hypothetical protein
MNILADKAKSESTLFTVIGYILALIGALLAAIFGASIAFTAKGKETDNGNNDLNLKTLIQGKNTRKAMTTTQ